MQNVRFLLSVIILFSGLVSRSYAGDVNILDYGASVDAENNAPYIQKAIDRCATTGGGIVHVPSGTFVSGTIFLKSNVQLNLHVNAVIQGSINHPADYPAQALVTGEDIENAAVTGEGILEGQGNHSRFQYGDNKGNRPHLILFTRCRKMEVKGITLRNSAWWTLRLAFCDGVRVQGIHIYGHGNHNVDGIDIDSKNVIISDCRIDCDDDAICFKSDDAQYVVEHVVITNCIISSNCNGIKFGTASHGGFRNIAISNCIIHKASESNIRNWRSIRGVSADTTVLSGIALEVVDGGFMDQVVISNISMRDIQTPLFIRLGSRTTAGSLRNVLVSGIVACNQSLITSSVTGIPGHPVENVTLRDFVLYYTGGANREDATAPVPENEKAYPENRMFGATLPAYGLYARHVQNLTIENFQCYTQQADARPAFVFDDVHNLSLTGFQASCPSGEQALIRLEQSSGVSIQGYRATQPAPLFLQAKGDRCRNISVVQNDFTQVRNVFDGDSSLKKEIYFQNNNTK
jgi:polygalacturonase